MSRACCIRRVGLLGLVLMLIGPSARAGQVWNVSLDTSRLAADYGGGPFALDFELIGTNGNTVTLGAFSFGGGTAGPGLAFLTGGASGDLGSLVTLNDSANFFSDFNQQFTPGSTLSFTVDSTLVPPSPGGTPDNFSIVIFTAYDPVNGYNPFTGTGGTPIPTTDPTGSDTFLNMDINGPGATTPTGYPGANGDIPITITPAGAVPEPSSGVLMILGLLGIMGVACRHRICG
jgi:PEP-CTERM motif